MKKSDQTKRSPGRNFFELTKADCFTEKSKNPGEWIRERRKLLNLTLTDVGELIDVHRIQVWKWEKGQVTPPKGAMLCLMFLQIIREFGDEETTLATYPTSQQVRLMKTISNRQYREELDELLEKQNQKIRR